ncbi:hypothetical protein KR044_006614, partial [Drosophila immigrans]
FHFCVVICILLYLLALAAFVLCAAKRTKKLEDLSEAFEITTRSALRSTVGRTRQTLMQSSGLADNKTDMYCCFWLYPDHPDLPDEWEHRAEYPFDFLFDGNFLKNERDHRDE